MIALARELGLRTVSGCAAEHSTQRIAHVGTADDVVVCIEGPDAEVVVTTARCVAPAAKIQAAVSNPALATLLREAGADNVLVLSELAGILLARLAVES